MLIILKTKIKEALNAWSDGVDEIDVVWNLGLFKEKKYLATMQELQSIIQHLGKNEVKVKVIVETCYLDSNEIRIAHQIVKDSGAFCIKTSTGFGIEGAQFTDIVHLKALGDLKIKASGGIKSLISALMLIKGGADIIGTSHGVSIVKEEQVAERNKKFRIPDKFLGEKDADSKLPKGR